MGGVCALIWCLKLTHTHTNAHTHTVFQGEGEPLEATDVVLETVRLVAEVRKVCVSITF